MSFNLIYVVLTDLLGQLNQNIKALWRRFYLKRKQKKEKHFVKTLAAERCFMKC